jgi:hypothetical protein
MVHGSEQELGKLVLPQAPVMLGWLHNPKQTQAYRLSKWLVEAPLGPLPCDPLTIPRDPDQPENVWLGTASIHFPSLSNQKTLERGLWCRGCGSNHQRVWYMSSNQRSSLVPLNLEDDHVLEGKRYRARSKSGFLEHVQHCSGIESVISDSVIGREQ